MRALLCLVLCPTLAAGQAPLREMRVDEMLAFVRQHQRMRHSLVKQTQVRTRLFLLGKSDDGLRVAHYVPRKKDLPVLLARMKDRALDLPARLCVARFLLPSGHLDARGFVDRHLRGKDRRNLHEAAEALHQHVRDDAPEARVWSTDRLIALLKSRRLEDRVAFPSNVYRHIVGVLASHEVLRAIPVLVAILRRNPDDRSVPYALAALGDKDGDTAVLRALTDTLVDHERKRIRRRQVYAMGELKHEPATPILCHWLGKDEAPDDVILEALSKIRDPRAAPALKAFLASKPPAREGLQAHIALAVLERDPVPVLLRRLDLHAGVVGKALVIRALETFRDDRVTARLLTMARTSERGYLRANAIEGLGAVGTPKAVEGLIGLLDLTFPPLWYATRNDPKQYHRLAGNALRRATGKHYGTDREKWRRWLANR